MSTEKNNRLLVNIRYFSPYTPELSEDIYPGAAYLKSEDGQDWYECQQLFADDTLKFTYNEKGVVTCITKDVSGLWPFGQSVAEVPDTEESRAVDISGNWVFTGEKLAPRIPDHSEFVAKAEDEKARLMTEARNTISVLQDAVELEMATAEETARLKRWRQYRVLLSRVDTSTAPDINWPPIPE